MCNTTRIVTLCAALVMLAAPATADEVADGDFLTPREHAIVAEINLARTQPREYAEFVESWIMFYKDKIREMPGRPRIRTQEGLSAVREAVAYLRRQEALHPLQPVRGMSYGARDHVADMGPAGATGHTGYDDSDSSERVNRYGKWQRKVDENIAYGSEDPREIVIRLIVDDGVKSRGHRHNIFDPDFRVIGAAFGYHRIFETMCVTTFAVDYLE